MARGETLIGVHRSLVTHGVLQAEVRWQDLQRFNGWNRPGRVATGSVLRVPLAWLATSSEGADLVHVYGDVRIEEPGGSSRAAAAGGRLALGERLVTGDKASASIRFLDGSVSLVTPGSRVRLVRHQRSVAGHASQTGLALEAGSLETRVPPGRPATQFEVETPKAKLGVRGTSFRGRVEPARTFAEVLTGAVAAGPRALSAGTGAVASDQGVSEPVRLLPAPDLGAVPARWLRLPAAQPFAPTPGAQRYRVMLFSTLGSDTLLATNVVTAPVASFNEAPADGPYELRVRAIDAMGLEGAEARAPIEVAARPVPPIQTQPRADHRQYASQAMLAWASQPEAQRYRLHIAAAPAGAVAEAEANQVHASEPASTSWQGSLPPGRYAWRVASVRADGRVGPWGDPRIFTIETAPPAAVPAPPRLSDTGIEFGWPAAPIPNARYEVQVARDAGFTQLVLNETLATTSTQLAQPASGTYHVRVQVVTPDGWRSGYGPTQTIEVPPRPWWLWFAPLLLLL
jgi:hypothetical protein